MSSLNSRRNNFVIRGKWNLIFPREKNDPETQGRENSLKRHAPKSSYKSILKRSKVDASYVVKDKTQAR